MDGAKAIHVMLDLETLGNGNNAAVWSIGAVKFSLTDMQFERQNFYVTIDPESAEACGLKIDASTVKWWMKPELAEARNLLLEPGALDLPTALIGFAEWLPPKEQLVGLWGNGATFDNVILRNAYKACNIECPWSFRVDRCFRTMNQMFPMEGKPRKGVAHSAVDDAMNQADHLISIWDNVQRQMF